MNNEGQNVYVSGVGGQGIGLLSETLLRAADHAGLRAMGVDTHGLAQRGGVVSSHLRTGPKAHSPLVSAAEADLVIALERHEALRGMLEYSAPGGVLVYYDTELQPVSVRLGKAKRVTAEMLQSACDSSHIRCIAVRTELDDSRMQNIAVLGTIAKEKLLEGVEPEHYVKALGDLIHGASLEANVALFERICTGG